MENADKQPVTGSEALLKALAAEGVDTIFGYPGGQIMPVYDRLYDYADRLATFWSATSRERFTRLRAMPG